MFSVYPACAWLLAAGRVDRRQLRVATQDSVTSVTRRAEHGCIVYSIATHPPLCPHLQPRPLSPRAAARQTLGSFEPAAAGPHARQQCVACTRAEPPGAARPAGKYNYSFFSPGLIMSNERTESTSGCCVRVSTLPAHTRHGARKAAGAALWSYLLSMSYQ